MLGEAKESSGKGQTDYCSKAKGYIDAFFFFSFFLSFFFFFFKSDSSKINTGKKRKHAGLTFVGKVLGLNDEDIFFCCSLF